MIEFEQKVFINRPQQDVFEIITNPGKSPLWQGGTEAAEWSSAAPYAVGSPWKSHNKFLGRNLEAELVVTGWDSPKLVSFKTANGPIPMEITNELEPQDGGTNLITKGRAEFGGLFKLAEGLISKQLEKQMDTDHNTLKLLMESNQL